MAVFETKQEFVIVGALLFIHGLVFFAIYFMKKKMSDGVNEVDLVDVVPAANTNTSTTNSYTPDLIPPEPTVSQTHGMDLPPSYEEILNETQISPVICLNKKNTSGRHGTSDIFVISITEQIDEQNDQNLPPDYWTSAHQLPEYPGFR